MFTTCELLAPSADCETLTVSAVCVTSDIPLETSP